MSFAVFATGTRKSLALPSVALLLATVTERQERWMRWFVKEVEHRFRMVSCMYYYY
jgi:hypothetical protein